MFSVNISTQYGEKTRDALTKNRRSKFVGWRDCTGVIGLSGGTVRGIGLCRPTRTACVARLHDAV